MGMMLRDRRLRVESEDNAAAQRTRRATRAADRWSGWFDQPAEPKSSRGSPVLSRHRVPLGVSLDCNQLDQGPDKGDDKSDV